MLIFSKECVQGAIRAATSQIHQFSYHICIIMDRIVPSQNDFIMKSLLRMSVCLSVQMSFLSLVTLGRTL